MKARRATAVLGGALLLSLALAQQTNAAGSFQSSDPLLNAIWQASVETADDSVSAPVDLDPRNCDIALPLVLLDSPIRDRCPYIGDEAVDGMTLLIAGENVGVLRQMIAWFASVQTSHGWIPASPIYRHTLELFDYNAYWVETLYDYTLYTGDLSLLEQVYPHLLRLIDVYYAAHLDQRGLLVNWHPNDDYAFILRNGTTVAYYNAQYARALGMASTLAAWEGDSAHVSNWRARARAVAASFTDAFWDPAAGAFTDTKSDTSVHPLDGNAFAILAGLATTAQERSALEYIDRTMSRIQGDTITDSDAWDRPGWGDRGVDRISPFMSYFDVLARYTAGDDDSALDLIRREWGWMLNNGPGTMWESIDAATGSTVNATPELAPSLDHGWSSGAAPALTSQVLGVQPTSPGFATFTVTPHPGDLASAEGNVPTPHGTIHVAWQITHGNLSVRVGAPAGTVWANNPAAPTSAVARTPTAKAMPAGTKKKPAKRTKERKRTQPAPRNPRLA